MSPDASYAHYYTEVDIFLDDEDNIDPAPPAPKQNTLVIPERFILPIPTRSPAYGSFTSAMADSSQEEATSKPSAPSEIFQSITCTPGLSHSSFEELRLECYLQSIVATGSKPKPCSEQARPFPPSYAPYRAPEDSQPREKPVDVVMSLQPAMSCAFTFSFPHPAIPDSSSLLQEATA